LPPARELIAEEATKLARGHRVQAARGHTTLQQHHQPARWP
jgi:hypothetical protein